MKYIATFVRKNLFHNFCLPELISLCEMYNVHLIYDKKFSGNVKMDPMIEIVINGIEDTDIAEKICSRSVLINSIVKIYSEGKTFEEMVYNIKTEEFMNEIESGESFKFEIDARGISYSQEEKINAMKYFACFDFKGKVDLKNPQRTFVIIDNHYRGIKLFGKLIAGKDDDARYYSKYSLDHRKYLGPTTTDNVLSFIMCNLGQVVKNQSVLDPFVGTGSLLIPPSHFEAFTFGCDLDVRVLKGYSIGYTPKTHKCGHVKKKEGNIFTNFISYGLKLPQITRQDINHPFFRNNEFFDAIICDPPYGHRAFSKKTGMSQERRERRLRRLKQRQEVKQHEQEDNNQSISSDESLSQENNEDVQTEQTPQVVTSSQVIIPSSNDNVSTSQISFTSSNNETNPQVSFTSSTYVAYPNQQKSDTHPFYPLKQCTVDQIFDNLLILGSYCIRKNGLLVCLYPTKRPKDMLDLVHLPINFPMHPDFHLIHACENPYSSLKSRWCLVYRKI